MAVDRIAAPPRTLDAEGTAKPSGTAAGGALAEAARDFEALFLQQFFKAASKPLFDDTPLGGSSTEQLYRELFVEEVAARAARDRGLGLANALARAAGDEE